MAVDLIFHFLLMLATSIVHAILVFSHNTVSSAQSRLLYSENNLLNATIVQATYISILKLSMF